MDFDIYFDDLAAEVQQEILEYYGINDVHEETNWDIMPIATIVLGYRSGWFKK